MLDTPILSIVERKASTRLDQIARNINVRLNRAAEDVMYIGERLLEARSLVPHGGWEDWVDTNLDISVRTAQRWMTIARHFAQSDILAFLKPAHLVMLASSSVPPGAVQEIERRARAGEAFKGKGIEAVIDKYRTLEGVNLGSKVLLAEYGVDDDGSPARTISRSALTSLEQVSADALERAHVEIDGIDHPVPDPQPEAMSQPIPDTPPLPNTIRAAVASATATRQADHIHDSPRYAVVVKRQEVKTFVAAGYNGTLNLVLNVLDVGGQFTPGEVVYVTVERAIGNLN